MNYMKFYSQRFQKQQFGATSPFKDPMFAIVCLGALGVLAVTLTSRDN